MSYYQQLLKKHGIELKDGYAKRYRIHNYETGKYSERIGRVERTPKAITETGNRICCICKVEKTKECFSPNRQKEDGLDARCKPCKSEQVMKYRRRLT